MVLPGDLARSAGDFPSGAAVALNAGSQDQRVILLILASFMIHSGWHRRRIFCYRTNCFPSVLRRRIPGWSCLVGYLDKHRDVIGTGTFTGRVPQSGNNPLTLRKRYGFPCREGYFPCRVPGHAVLSHSVGNTGRCHAKYNAEYSAMMSTPITITAYLTAVLWRVMPSSSVPL
jgi:hypothetical protein